MVGTHVDRQEKIMRIFIGVDPRQPIAYHVLCSSIMRNASKPVSITPLLIDQLPIDRTGLTDFTFTRFLVPWLCGYEGQGIFLDSDMLVLGDITRLTTDAPVSVVNHEGEFGFERPSVMVFDCAQCEVLTPEFVSSEVLFDFAWAEVGELDRDWNFLVGYEQPRGGINLLHYTQGIPEYKECRNCDYAGVWFEEKERMLSSVSWLEVMGNSVHAEHVLKGLRA